MRSGDKLIGFRPQMNIALDIYRKNKLVLRISGLKKSALGHRISSNRPCIQEATSTRYMEHYRLW